MVRGWKDCYRRTVDFQYLVDYINHFIRTVQRYIYLHLIAKRKAWKIKTILSSPSSIQPLIKVSETTHFPCIVLSGSTGIKRKKYRWHSPVTTSLSVKSRFRTIITLSTPNSTSNWSSRSSTASRTPRTPTWIPSFPHLLASNWSGAVCLLSNLKSCQNHCCAFGWNTSLKRSTKSVFTISLNLDEN